MQTRSTRAGRATSSTSLALSSPPKVPVGSTLLHHGSIWVVTFLQPREHAAGLSQGRIDGEQRKMLISHETRHGMNRCILATPLPAAFFESFVRLVFSVRRGAVPEPRRLRSIPGTCTLGVMYETRTNRERATLSPQHPQRHLALRSVLAAKDSPPPRLTRPVKVLE